VSNLYACVDSNVICCFRIILSRTLLLKHESIKLDTHLVKSKRGLAWKLGLALCTLQLSLIIAWFASASLTTVQTCSFSSSYAVIPAFVVGSRIGFSVVGFFVNLSVRNVWSPFGELRIFLNNLALVVSIFCLDLLFEVVLSNLYNVVRLERFLVPCFFFWIMLFVLFLPRIMHAMRKKSIANVLFRSAEEDDPTGIRNAIFEEGMMQAGVVSAKIHQLQSDLKFLEVQRERLSTSIAKMKENMDQAADNRGTIALIRGEVMMSMDLGSTQGSGSKSFANIFGDRRSKNSLPTQADFNRKITGAANASPSPKTSSGTIKLSEVKEDKVLSAQHSGSTLRTSGAKSPQQRSRGTSLTSNPSLEMPLL
jgi:hypothetical protein